MKIRRARRPSDPPTPREEGNLRILVCGDRNWVNRDTIRFHLLKIVMDYGFHGYDDVWVITGGAPGADTITAELCRDEYNIACAVFSAPWKYWRRQAGRQRMAGPTRNYWMLKWGMPNALLAFHPDLAESKGTANMIKLAKANGLPESRIRVVTR